MAISRIPVFAGLGSDLLFSAKNLDQLKKDAGSHEAQSLLHACHRTFLQEIEKANGELLDSCVVNPEDFCKVDSMLSPPKSYHRNAAVQHAFICVMQLLRYMNHEKTSTTKVLGVSGFCAGLFPAVAAATSRTSLEFISRADQCFRVAVKVGLASERYCRKTSTTKSNQPWSLIVDGLSCEEVMRILSDSNEQGPSSIFVSARNSENCVTLSGEGSSLRAFADSKLTGNSRVRSTNIYALYHNRHALGELSARLLEDVRDGGLSFPGVSDLVYPIYRTTDGSQIEVGESSRPDLLLNQVLEMIFLEPVDWMAVQESILSSATRSATIQNELAQIQNFGPGYGALTYRKDLPKGVEVVDVSSSTESEQKWSKGDIAIVGMALDVPGAQMDTAKLWQNIMNSVSICSKIPGDRFHIEDYHSDDKSKLGNQNRSMDTQYGSFLENPFLFDNTFFGISPREARSMDPQQRLLLQTAQRALEDAGYVGNATKSFSTSTFGCYIGAATGDYAENLKEEMDVYWVPGVLRSFLSGRISYAYGWGGPALTVDTACSSSIVAIWQAVRALQSGDANACLAGGVNVVTSPDMYIGLDRAHFLSPTGQCKSFDDPADGYCRADGSACLVLKRIEDALAENDRILGVIKGIEVNQSGTAHSITHPHTPTQERLFKSVWQKHGIDPLKVSVVEAHGTGTEAGDPSELHGITNSLCIDGRGPSNPLVVGSLKANIGHSEAASGTVSLIKLLLMFRYQTIPPQILFNKPNSELEALATRGIVINREAKPWKTKRDQPRLAMLNNFGGSGSNGALIVQEFAPVNPPTERLHQLTYCFSCSAKTRGTLVQMRQDILRQLEAEENNLSILDICYTSTARRQIYDYRLSTTANSVEQLTQNLKDAEVLDCTRTKVTSGPNEAVFLFSGQGSQYLGMGKELMEMYPSFAQTVNHCHRLLVAWGYPSCLEVIHAEEGLEMHADDTTRLQAFQTGVFVLEVALARLIMSFGIKPKAVAGHSLGEYAALVVSGVLELENALRIVAYRASLIVDRCLLPRTCMLAVASPSSKVQEVLDAQHDFNVLRISCDNSSQDCVVGGPTEALQILKIALEKRIKARSTMLDVPVAYHTDSLAPIAERLTEHARQLKFSPPSIPIASNLLGGVVVAGEDVFKPEYFASHCRQRVEFDRSLDSLTNLDSTLADGLWVEIGPHPVVLPMLKSRLSGSQGQRLSTLRKTTHPSESISQLLSQLYISMPGIHWRASFEGLQQKPALVTLPGVPFVRKEFNVRYPRDYISHTPDGTEIGGRAKHGRTPYEFLSQIISHPTPKQPENVTFETPIQDLAIYIGGHSVCGYALCPASVYCELALSAAQFLEHTRNTLSLSNVTIPKSLVYRDHDVDPQDLDIIVRVKITNSVDTPGMRNFVISSYEQNSGPGNSQVHCQGCVKSLSEAKLQDKYMGLDSVLDQRKTNFVKVDPEVLQAFSSSTLYEKVFTRTVNYSEMYKSIRSIKINTTTRQALATCRLYSSRHTGIFVADPVLLDAVFHVAGFTANLFAANDELYIANVFKSATMMRAIASTDKPFQIYCANYDVDGGKTVLANAYAMDSDGVFAVIKSMRFERVKISDRSLAFGVMADRSGGNLSQEQKRICEDEGFDETPRTSVSHDRVSESSSSRLVSPQSRSSNSTPPSIASTPSAPGFAHDRRAPEQKDLMATVSAIVAETSGTEAKQVQPHTNLESLGIDSLMVHELQDKLAGLTDTKLSVSELTKCTVVGDVGRLMDEGLFNEQDISEVSLTRLNENGRTLVSEPLPHDERTQGPFITALPLESSRPASNFRETVRRVFHLNEQIQLLQPFSFCKEQETEPIPLFLIHPGSGLAVEYRKLNYLGRRVWTIQNPEFMNPGAWDGIMSMAHAYAALVSSTNEERCIIGGWSFGGVIAFEAARILVRKGHQVAGVVLIDTPPPNDLVNRSLPREAINAATGPPKGQPINDAVRELIRRNNLASSEMLESFDLEPGGQCPRVIMLKATDAFECPDLDVPYHPWLDRSVKGGSVAKGWEKIVEKIKFVDIPGNHFNLFDGENITSTSNALFDACAEIQREEDSI